MVGCCELQPHTNARQVGLEHTLTAVVCFDGYRDLTPFPATHQPHVLDALHPGRLVVDAERWGEAADSDALGVHSPACRSLCQEAPSVR